MSLRLKLVLALVLLAAFSTVAIGAVSYVATADQLRSSIDTSLSQEAQLDQATDPDHDHDQTQGPTDGRKGDYGVSRQVIAADGTVVSSPMDPPLPVSAEDIEVARSATDGVRVTPRRGGGRRLLPRAHGVQRRPGTAGRGCTPAASPSRTTCSTTSAPAPPSRWSW